MALDYGLECLAFDLIIKLTRAQEKRNKILSLSGSDISDDEQEELDKLTKEISSTLEKLKRLYDFH